ncbi:sensor histidine kinase [Dyadobacter subterraneus]|uniref:Histidine kinase n=1 Tax=Dyadobacter subterraneus TaxID=2773304 RepID=A0ABR9WDZ4_9BACT|nr:histidine kinase [Dyadobacter subterraneus]MBE9463695.1 histidine kinase [Dyadobacter subterraneus]
MDKNEQRICWYSSLLIALMVNSPKLLALRENGLMARYWHFNPYELLFQFAFSLTFCGLLFTINLFRGGWLSSYREKERYLPYAVFNILVFFGLLMTGAVLRRLFFPNLPSTRLVFSGSLFRLGLSTILTGIIIKIVLLIRNSSSMAAENQQLKNAYLASELQLLKEQMNPHFLFNSLSSLSAVVRENPQQAQKYIRDMSAVFRYALVGSHTDLVTLSNELTMLGSFAKLISMRLEDAFELKINIADAHLPIKIPHLSLQPLLENAVKHNAATAERPLQVTIEAKDDQLIFSNSLWEIPTPEASNGMGLANLNERFRILLHQEIEISRSETHFIVKLPLQQ